MNKKGFTIIELAVSFCLVATISIILLQLVLSLKDIYISGDVKTTLLNKQGIMTKKIYEELDSKTLKSIDSCGLSCLTFSYNDDTSSKLLVDPGNKTLTFGDYTMELDSSSYFDTVSFDTNSGSMSDSSSDHIFKISIPIKSKLIDDEDFGISIVKIYNKDEVSINKSIDIKTTSVILSGVDTKIYYMSNGSDIEDAYIKLFHQEKGNNVDTYEKFIKNKSDKTMSTLTSLSAFKMQDENNINNLVNFLKGDGVSENELKQTYQDGYYDFILNYNTLENNNELTDNGYLHFYQTNDISKKEKLSGFGADTVTNDFNGLTYNESSTYFVSNITNNNYLLGAKNGTITGKNSDGANKGSVDLFVNAKEYICKYSLSDVSVTLNGNSINIKSSLCK